MVLTITACTATATCMHGAYYYCLYCYCDMHAWCLLLLLVLLLRHACMVLTITACTATATCMHITACTATVTCMHGAYYYCLYRYCDMHAWCLLLLQHLITKYDKDGAVRG